ncbi:MAG TPA: choice-of-anchor Q domain-containing protein [Candidatus Sulfotelmatobacter sp.]|nr:choice-of-anchor Q domain-containing protein [Candidatus Sulfotelmatobacter sp.]
MRFNPERLTGIALLLALAPLVSATTRYVNGVNGSDSNNCLSITTACKTIGHAISLAASGDTVLIAAATYTENLTIGKSLKLIGSGASIIDGGNGSTVVTVSSTIAHVILSNLTIRNGQASTVLFIGFRDRALAGGGISNSGTLTLTNSIVSGNWAPIPCIQSFLFCQLRFGTALGGGIYNSGALIIISSIISGNHAGSYCNANPCSAFGGGIYNAGTLMTIKNSTLTGNSVSTACSTSLSCRVGVGGAFYTVGTVTLNNSTVTGSTAYRCSGVCDGMGGAIVNGSGNLALNNSTVGGNPAGGIVNAATSTLQNSLIANNSGANCGGAITSHGYNLSSDNTCKFNGPGDMNNINPLLGTLANNGGPTPTIALLEGSPAIDAGNHAGCTDGSGHLLTTDQRGQPRPDKEDTVGCDIGAYEKQSD